ncbi:MAG: hypothetical protein IT204_08005 [Fimbriimonadaceae bacterium]|nr:hypothetical protein [Fimbriimonadaceae bacterium]
MQPRRTRPRRWWSGLAAGCVLLLTAPLRAAVDPLPEQVAEALRGVTAWVLQQATEGGWPATLRLSDGQRGGPDGPLGPRAVAPAGTAAVGLVLLEAWELAGEEPYRTGALGAARCLAAAQTAAGGWLPTHDFGADLIYTRRAYLAGEPAGQRLDGAWLASGGSAPVALLCQTATATGDADLQAAAAAAVRCLAATQLGHGGWPARWPLAAGDRQPADALATANLVAALLTCGQVDPSLAERGGDFLLLAQRADGGWSRRSGATLEATGEPDAAATRAACQALLALHAVGGSERWLEPLRAALPALQLDPTAAELLDVVRRRLRQPAHANRPPTREERAQRTAARAPRMRELLAQVDDEGRWLRDGVWSAADYVARAGELLQWLRDYEPLPDFPGSADGRPPQHRRN